MWRRMFAPAVLLVAPLISPTAFAAFGLGPCCPPSLCGMIPCDAMCAGPAITQMGTSVSTQGNNLNTGYQNLGSGVQDVIESMKNMGLDVSDALNTQNNDMLEGLSASSTRLELATTAATKSLERNTDHTVSSLVTALRQQGIGKAAAENQLIIGQQSQPVSGDTGTELALTFHKLGAQMSQAFAAAVAGFANYLNDGNNTVTSAGKGQHAALSLKALDTFDRADFLLTKSVLNDEEFQAMQILMGLMVARAPLPKGDLPDETNYELSRRRYTTMMAIAFSGLLQPALARKGIDKGDWVGYYQDLLRNDGGEAGLAALYRADILGRVTDPEWWGSIRRLPPAGLERESTYQTAMSLHLKNRLNTLSQSADQLLAVALAARLQTKAREAAALYQRL